MRFVLFQVNANFQINQLKNIFTQGTWRCSFIASKNLRSPSQNLLKTSTFHPFILVLTVVEVSNITNKNQSPTNLAKYQYFYTRDFISFLHYGKKLALSIARGFRNIYFLSHFHYFWRCVKLVIFQINADFLINQLRKYFTQNTWDCSLIPTKNLCSPSHKFLEISTFYHMSSSFHIPWVVQYFK